MGGQETGVSTTAYCRYDPTTLPRRCAESESWSTDASSVEREEGAVVDRYADCKL